MERRRIPLSCKVVARLDVLDRVSRAVIDFYVRDGIVVIRVRILQLRWWTGRVVFDPKSNWLYVLESLDLIYIYIYSCCDGVLN